MTTINLQVTFPTEPRGPAYEKQMVDAFRAQVRHLAESFDRAWGFPDGTVTVGEQAVLTPEEHRSLVSIVTEALEHMETIGYGTAEGDTEGRAVVARVTSILEKVSNPKVRT